jgi:hypothetical protein
MLQIMAHCVKKTTFYCSLSMQPPFNFNFYLLFNEIKTATSKLTLNLIDNPFDDSPSTPDMVVDQRTFIGPWFKFFNRLVFKQTLCVPLTTH